MQTIGDGFFVVFDDSGSAVAAAIAAQRALADDDWPGRVRIGMHTGHARPTNGDYTALVVHQAARVVGAARGGQVLITAETAAGLDESLVRPLGRFRVRDFESPIALYAATGEGVPAVEAQPRVVPGRRPQSDPTGHLDRRSRRRSRAVERADRGGEGDEPDRPRGRGQDPVRRLRSRSRSRANGSTGRGSSIWPLSTTLA